MHGHVMSHVTLLSCLFMWFLLVQYMCTLASNWIQPAVANPARQAGARKLEFVRFLSKFRMIDNDYHWLSHCSIFKSILPRPTFHSVIITKRLRHKWLVDSSMFDMFGFWWFLHLIPVQTWCKTSATRRKKLQTSAISINVTKLMMVLPKILKKRT
jgi:hypothetical protein